MIKLIYVTIGIISLSAGAVGTIIPLLPAFPFLLISSICFAKSSKKLHNWFISTKLYKENLESLFTKKGMTKKAKIRVMSVISLTMAFGFVMMKNVPIGRIILVFVWIFHVLYFVYGIKNLETAE